MVSYDAHVHLFFAGCETFAEAAALHTPAPNEEQLRSALKQYQKAGITLLRDGGDRFGVSLAAKKLAPEYGITLLSAGWPLVQAGKCGSAPVRAFADGAEFQVCLQELREAGADFVHLLASGLPELGEYGALQGEPMDPELLKECIAAAHAEGFPVMVHCSGPELATAAVEAGADSLEHGWYLDNETLRILAESDTVWVPSTVTAGNCIDDDTHRYPEAVLKRILDEQLWKTGTMAGWGGNIALGSNAGFYRCSGVQAAFDEYEFLKEELGENLDSLLQSGEVMLRWKFHCLPC